MIIYNISALHFTVLFGTKIMCFCWLAIYGYYYPCKVDVIIAGTLNYLLIYYYINTKKDKNKTRMPTLISSDEQKFCMDKLYWTIENHETYRKDEYICLL